MFNSHPRSRSHGYCGFFLKSSGKTGQKGWKGLNKMKVLIVEDNEELSALLKERLEIEGFAHIKTAENGETGHLTFRRFQPDIVLTDIEMPLKNGLEMVKEIRTHHPETKTIYMSANLQKHRRALEEEQIKYNAVILSKPFSFTKVIGLLQEYQEERKCRSGRNHSPPGWPHEYNLRAV
jgi:two-component system, OmpR family, response regulator CpxR